MVPQEAFLFSGTIAENIAYGRRAPPGRRSSAPRGAVHAHEAIAALPAGYDTGPWARAGPP